MPAIVRREIQALFSRNDIEGSLPCLVFMT